MGTNGVAQSLPHLLAQPGQAPLVGFGVDPQHGLRGDVGDRVRELVGQQPAPRAVPRRDERADLLARTGDIHVGTSARRASAAVIEERISHEPLYGSPGVPLGVKAMRTRS